MIVVDVAGAHGEPMTAPINTPSPHSFLTPDDDIRPAWNPDTHLAPHPSTRASEWIQLAPLGSTGECSVHGRRREESTYRGVGGDSSDRKGATTSDQEHVADDEHGGEEGGRQLGGSALDPGWNPWDVL